MSSKYYDDAGKEVYDGDTVFAADSNTINTAINAGFELAETDITLTEYYAAASETSADASAASETNAASSEASTASLYDQFDDRYLGDKSSDPTLDNDGDALLTGALYFNTSTDKMRVYDGADWLLAYANVTTQGLQSQQIFTSSGTWTKPLGINLVKVTVIGGGGGGGSEVVGSESSSGAGAGATSYKLIDVSAISSETITVGSAGVAGTTGTTGGTSSFGTHCSSGGGAGGVFTTGADIGGVGGTATGGDINISGQQGGSSGVGLGTNINNPSYGGSSSIGVGGMPNSSGGTTGTDPVGYGAGGAGEVNAVGSEGTDGIQGIVIVEEYA